MLVSKCLGLMKILSPQWLWRYIYFSPHHFLNWIQLVDSNCCIQYCIAASCTTLYLLLICWLSIHEHRGSFSNLWQFTLNFGTCFYIILVLITFYQVHVLMAWKKYLGYFYLDKFGFLPSSSHLSCRSLRPAGTHTEETSCLLQSLRKDLPKDLNSCFDGFKEMLRGFELNFYLDKFGSLPSSSHLSCRSL